MSNRKGRELPDQGLIRDYKEKPNQLSHPSPSPLPPGERDALSPFPRCEGVWAGARVEMPHFGEVSKPIEVRNIQKIHVKMCSKRATMLYPLDLNLERMAEGALMPVTRFPL